MVGFHGLRAVAPLKHLSGMSEDEQITLFPRPQSRGPIEAVEPCGSAEGADAVSTASEPWPHYNRDTL